MHPAPEWTQLRHELHARAETAFAETETSGHVQGVLRELGADIIATDVAGTGILARLGKGQPNILLRAELDALPLTEETGATYASSTAHHACGHDGHMTMLLAALAELADQPPCTVWALFQPAEETGQGMARCLEHPAFPTQLDAVAAIHNVPGAPLGRVLLAEGTAAVASTGIVIQWTGATSHAAEPEAGRNPIPVAAKLVPIVQDSPKHGDAYAKAALVEIQGGGPRFGTSAGDCRLAATLRAGSDDALQAMIDAIDDAAHAAAEDAGLECTITHVEPFPATSNAADIVGAVRRAAKQAGLDVDDVEPFPWSEDFGHATARWPGALIGLGSGERQAPLHSPDYDFPDRLIDHGRKFWRAFVEELM